MRWAWIILVIFVLSGAAGYQRENDEYQQAEDEYQQLMLQQEEDEYRQAEDDAAAYAEVEHQQEVTVANEMLMYEQQWLDNEYHDQQQAEMNSAMDQMQYQGDYYTYENY